MTPKQLAAELRLAFPGRMREAIAAIENGTHTRSDIAEIRRALQNRPIDEDIIRYEEAIYDLVYARRDSGDAL